MCVSIIACRIATHVFFQRHICGLLAALSTVRSLRLNLDFEDDDGPYCCMMLFKKWYLKFPGLRSEIIQSLRTCPRLQHVAFLHWFDLEAVWAGYTLSRGDSSMSRFSVTADTKDQYPKYVCFLCLRHASVSMRGCAGTSRRGRPVGEHAACVQFG